MAKVIIFFYDEKEERKRRKKLHGGKVSYEIEDDFVKIAVDEKDFLIKKEHMISLDITRD